MNWTSWDINGKHIEIEAEWVGDEPALWDDTNYNRHDITITVDGNHQEVFKAWASHAEPVFETEYQLKNIFRNIVSEAADVIWDEIDEALEGYPYSQAKQMEEGLRENAKKIIALGLDDDETLETILNNEEWQ